jgi:uncharacterized protein
MNLRFADTSFYIALLNERDEQHRHAVELATAFQGVVLTTEYVLVELGNWLAHSGNRQVFVRFLEVLARDTDTTIVPGDSQLFQKGVALYTNRQDKEWSLTDCTSFVVMADHEIDEALTADHHFEQAGFIRLMIT